ncbi:glycosyltransferase [Streptomyces sp. QH1-20]|uniref:glycosyltransferase n=1 Tax=Streptomyces sp. QH1-20 TaxID=3240934 RepID=UPI003515CA47
MSEVSASIIEQFMPHGWDWQWVVQEDGETGSIATALPRDPRISLGSGRAGGPAVARTLALARTTGELVRTLDADDTLLPGALARDIEILTTYPDLGWVTSQALSLLPDGSARPWEPPAEGPIKKDEVLSHWVETGGFPPVVPGTLCIRRSLLLALGGWMALPGAEDTGLLMAANTVSDGYFMRTPSLLYRQHTEQTTAQPYHTDLGRREERGRLIVARAEALRQLMMQHASAHPGDGDRPYNGRSTDRSTHALR